MSNSTFDMCDLKSIMLATAYTREQLIFSFRFRFYFRVLWAIIISAQQQQQHNAPLVLPNLILVDIKFRSYVLPTWTEIIAIYKIAQHICTQIRLIFFSSVESPFANRVFETPTKNSRLSSFTFPFVCQMKCAFVFIYHYISRHISFGRYRFWLSSLQLVQLYGIFAYRYTATIARFASPTKSYTF